MIPAFGIVILPRILVLRMGMFQAGVKVGTDTPTGLVSAARYTSLCAVTLHAVPHVG